MDLSIFDSYFTNNDAQYVLGAMSIDYVNVGNAGESNAGFIARVDQGAIGSTFYTDNTLAGVPSSKRTLSLSIPRNMFVSDTLETYSTQHVWTLDTTYVDSAVWKEFKDNVFQLDVEIIEN